MTEISFRFNKQKGMATNQFAVWVEDANGRYVKTLYASDFTAGKGGWKYRDTSLPLWVKRAHVNAKSKQQIDAISSATPNDSGDITLIWDGGDDMGKKMPAGRYVVYIEGSMRNDNHIVYSAEVDLEGEPHIPEVRLENPGDNPDGEKMLTNVTVVYTRKS